MSITNLEENSVQNPRITWEGCSVLLDINDGDRLVFARLTAGSYAPQLATIRKCFSRNNVPEKGDCPIKDEFKDNRALVDNNTAQSLTGEDIDAMRRQGATGDDIVEALIANSATFEKKTSFSQEKYRLKKQKKYAPKVLLRRPFARSICETYFKKYPARIGFLRVDNLSLLLSMANVTAHSDVLVVDKIGGILTGAVAERLGGTGYVCNTYVGATPYPIDIVRIFNFSKEIWKRIVRSPIADLCTARNETSVQSGHLPDACNNEEMLSPCSPSNTSAINGTLHPSENGKTPKAGEKAPQEVIELWREHGFSSLIVAAPDLDAWNIVKEVLSLVSFSAPFAIYHQYLQPLATCMHNLQLGKMAIGLQISEPWMREYQILPSRTHPHMQMSAFGGYILSGTRICVGDQPS
ncbi:hypothetical protein RJ640_026172 [Escallonia rubra]|uniref:tRNA (adenine(58)-N(1))-methyltransferase non-catalytic subunit TRM6 n=1 Tax=Escallonia rubra TaxID=112253 RepID=A0AA88UUX8_9ASTE|nr:hypothetical protein RJ640_026172 [Escallonia rubra]